MVAFLKEVYGRAKEADKFLMSQQPALKHSCYYRKKLRTSAVSQNGKIKNEFRVDA